MVHCVVCVPCGGSYQYNCVVGLLQFFNANVLPHIHIAVETAAGMFGRLRECVDDVLRK